MLVLRLTRHPATPEQVAALQRIYGSDVEIREHSETVPNAARVKELVAEYGADVLEAVLPLQMVAEVLREVPDVPLIRAITNRVFDETGQKAAFVFSHYERVTKVEVVTERL
ncbi:MAG TPA: hypothetical protein VNK70_01275 [Candidatus Paceibacterota bacterium]|nr:hypothetical protein [Candidatus Paceibacterota bacterium]